MKVNFVLLVFCFILIIQSLFYAQEKFQDVSLEVKQAIKEFQKRGVLYNFINKFDLRFNPAEPINRERFILALSEYDIQIRKLIERVYQLEKKMSQFTVSEEANYTKIIKDNQTVITDSTSAVKNISDLSLDISKLKSNCKIMDQVIKSNPIFESNNVKLEEMLIIDNHFHELYGVVNKKIDEFENNLKTINNVLIKLEKNYSIIKEKDIMKLSKEISDINNEIKQHKTSEEKKQKQLINNKEIPGLFFFNELH